MTRNGPVTRLPLTSTPPALSVTRTRRDDLHQGLALVGRSVELAEQTDILNLKARVWRVLGEVRRHRRDVAEANEALATALRLNETKGNVAAVAAVGNGR